MTEKYKVLEKEFENKLKIFSENVNKLLKEMFTSEIETEKEKVWEMKCPYSDGDEYYYATLDGSVYRGEWENSDTEKRWWKAGNIFPDNEATKLEYKRRNLLTRFKAFRDECNDGWEPDMADASYKKYCLFYSEMKNSLYVSYIVLGTHFHIFSYFKNEQDAERAIELFGDEIKKLFVDCECD